MCTNHLKKKHYTEAQALQWAIEIAKGLRYLHSAKPKVCAGISMHLQLSVALPIYVFSH